MRRKFILLFLSAITFSYGTFAQNADSSVVFQQVDTNKVEQPFDRADKYRTNLLPSMIVPGSLIILGLTSIKNNGIYSSYRARRDIQRSLGGLGSRIDDFLIFSPYAEFAALTIFKIRCKNDLLNTSLLILKSQLIMSAIVFPMKKLTAQERPYSWAQRHEKSLEERQKNPNAFLSLPSGHTAQAFVAATIVYREYRHRSHWYGVGAYALAASVGMYRMINDKHWLSDVLTGAGIGMLSANIAYATHQHRWGRKEVCFSPTFDPMTESKGIALVCKF